MNAAAPKGAAAFLWGHGFTRRGRAATKRVKRVDRWSEALRWCRGAASPKVGRGVCSRFGTLRVIRRRLWSRALPRGRAGKRALPSQARAPSAHLRCPALALAASAGVEQVRQMKNNGVSFCRMMFRSQRKASTGGNAMQKFIAKFEPLIQGVLSGPTAWCSAVVFARFNTPSGRNTRGGWGQAQGKIGRGTWEAQVWGVEGAHELLREYITEGGPQPGVRRHGRVVPSPAEAGWPTSNRALTVV
jgi:hypothetical protein